MGKVTSSRIIFVCKNDTTVISQDDPMMVAAEGPTTLLAPSQEGEELVQVFDQFGNWVGNVDHHEQKELT